MKIEMKLTEFLAVWGAVISSVALTWNIVRGLRDRGRLRLTARIMKDIDTHESSLVITITNIGKRPIKVNGCGFKAGKQMYIVNPVYFHSLPKTLEEGQDVTEYISNLSPLENVRKILAWDSRGKHWKARRKYIRALRKALSKLGPLEGDGQKGL